ncbi:MAG: hypothetical protein K6F69_04570 [Treponema sp.]|nr:hypothetical protein [Treponema sp.]
MENEVLKSNIKRVRIEIIFSQALEEDFITEFKANNVGKYYTKLFPVMGVGFSDPKFGDAIWPQYNMMYIIYCTQEEASVIKEIITKLRGIYKNNTDGIACFISNATEF